MADPKTPKKAAADKLTESEAARGQDAIDFAVDLARPDPPAPKPSIPDGTAMVGAVPFVDDLNTLTEGLPVRDPNAPLVPAPWTAPVMVHGCLHTLSIWSGVSVAVIATVLGLVLLNDQGTNSSISAVGSSSSPTTFASVPTISSTAAPVTTALPPASLPGHYAATIAWHGPSPCPPEGTRTPAAMDVTGTAPNIVITFTINGQSVPAPATLASNNSYRLKDGSGSGIFTVQGSQVLMAGTITTTCLDASATISVTAHK